MPVVHGGCSRRMMARNTDGGILFAVELRGRDPCRRLHRRLALAKERDEGWQGRHNVAAQARTEQRKLEAAPMDMSTTKVFHHLFALLFVIKDGREDCGEREEETGKRKERD